MGQGDGALSKEANKVMKLAKQDSMKPVGTGAVLTERGVD